MRAPSLSSFARGLLVASVLGGASVAAQVAQGPPPAAAVPQAARAAAPIDLAGTWAQVTTEDWQWRYITPAKGDYTAVPLTAEANKIAQAWDPDADVKAGAQCKPFGAASVMRLPTRMQIAWVDDNTLKFDWDLGTQTRVVSFDKTKQPGARSLQGHGVAEWIDVGGGGRGGRGGGGRGGAADGAPAAPGAGAGAAAPAAGAAAPAAQGRAAGPAGQGRGAGAPPAQAAGRGDGRGGGGAAAARPGGLKMVTTNLAAQYLRMNGVPLSENAVVTDYLDIVPAPNGDQWLIVKTIVEDPRYLSQAYITSQQFKKEPNASKWSPSPCELLPRAKGTATQVPGRGGE